jgi:hypothetical protein
MQVIKSAIAFTELLSLGFATIDVRSTLSAVGSRLILDVARALHHRRQPAPRGA